MTSTLTYEPAAAAACRSDCCTYLRRSTVELHDVRNSEILERWSCTLCDESELRAGSGRISQTGTALMVASKSQERAGAAPAMELMSTSEDSKAEYMYVTVRGRRFLPTRLLFYLFPL